MVKIQISSLRDFIIYMDDLVAEKELNFPPESNHLYQPSSEESRGNDDVHEGEGGGYVWLAASVQPAKQK